MSETPAKTKRTRKIAEIDLTSTASPAKPKRARKIKTQAEAAAVVEVSAPKPRRARKVTNRGAVSAEPTVAAPALDTEAMRIQRTDEDEIPEGVRDAVFHYPPVNVPADQPANLDPDLEATIADDLGVEGPDASQIDAAEIALLKGEVATKDATIAEKDARLEHASEVHVRQTARIAALETDLNNASDRVHELEADEINASEKARQDAMTIARLTDALTVGSSSLTEVLGRSWTLFGTKVRRDLAAIRDRISSAIA